MFSSHIHTVLKKEKFHRKSEIKPGRKSNRALSMVLQFNFMWGNIKVSSDVCSTGVDEWGGGEG